MFARLAVLTVFAVQILVGPVTAEIKIGVAVPLTGQYSWPGARVLTGVEQAVNDLNDAGGVLGQAIVLEIVDDFCDADQAVAAADKLTAEDVPVVLGHQCSGAAIPASERYEEHGIILISPGATNPQLTERGFRNVFRTVGRDDMQGGMVADYLAEHRPDAKIALVHDNRVYGKGIVDEAKQRLEKHGITPTLLESITPGETEFSGLIASLNEAEIEIAFYGGYQAEGGLLIRQAKNRLPDIQFIIPDGAGAGDFPLITGDAVAGVLMTWYSDPKTRPSASAAIESFKAAGFDVDKFDFEFYAYAAVEVWAQAVELAGATDTEKVAEALRSNRFDTAIGRIGFDAKGDVVGTEPFSWQLWNKDGYTPIDPANIRP